VNGTDQEARSGISFTQPKDNVLLMLKFSARQLDRIERQLEPPVAHFEQTQSGLGIAHLETEPVLFAFPTPVPENGVGESIAIF
jgi:hypothetical protein